ncbi:two-component sensor histidine kinase YcbL [Niallia circulans]|uniref:sensor histidine kinase n=1 Tax=Niallia circulans TaxID=1397 RepID=UPI00077C8118|nr:sensor histidine kinase [Niallia circulans]MDR4317594.1 HAMP domain-containing histidine kinase [Niallia circulans]MED3841044.1 sensor histidine kinase [Niallia circulans]MED4245407.1 sensor histidine kinase [Niallia circulans]MED4249344.1 sensor histidine kinase [Niallia circulans]QKH63270.1 sensor histidine kinase [Niallia circulans]
MIIWISIILVLLIFNVYQYRQRKNRDQHIAYLSTKLKKILQRQTNERILVVSNDQQLKDLLININQVLDDRHEKSREFIKMEHSMKRMLANISHDLKTPLTVIAGYIEMFQKDFPITETERVQLLSQVHDKTMELIQLMNTFFDLAKLESGDKEIPLEIVNLSELCRKNILTFHDWIRAKGLEAMIDIPDESVFALGNEEAVNRVLHNLLSNALRYGLDGKVIGLSLYFDEQQVYIEVFDRGKGIDEADQANIFERLFTLDDSRNKAFQGSGLGLTITKRLVEEMHGEISVHSIPYEKTSFNITFRRMNG